MRTAKIGPDLWFSPGQKKKSSHKETSSNSAPLISISYKESNGNNKVKPMITFNVLKGIPDNANFREGSYNCQDTEYI